MYLIKNPMITLLNNSTIESISKSDIIISILRPSKSITNNVRLLLVPECIQKKRRKGLNNKRREMV